MTHTILLFLLLGVSDSVPVTSYPGMNQVYGVAQPANSSKTIDYLGHRHTEAKCQASCAAHRPRCWSYTWFGPGSSSDFEKQCFGITSPRWSPTPDVSSIVSGTLEWPCRNDDDCSLNGKCSAGQCTCKPQWRGTRCQTLALAPAVRGSGYRGLDGGYNTSSWGGAVLRGDDGRYHMWASEMTEHCGIGAWAQNSRVIHSVADTAGGTYRRVGVVWNVFAHEPMMARGDKGEWVMYFTSNRANKTHGVCNCCQENVSRCDGSTGPRDCPSAGGRARFDMGVGAGLVGSGDSSPTWMSYAPTPYGPWSVPAHIFPKWVGSDTNFAPLILPNGSLVGLWRSWEATGSRVFTVTASSWREPDTYIQHHHEVISTDLGTAGTEDPFVYLDGDGHFHAIFHHMYGEGTSTQWWLDTDGGHAFSHDGLEWTYSGVAWGNAQHPRGQAVNFTDGTSFAFTRRERPHFIFDAAGNPAYLTNAAQYGPGKLPAVKPADNGDASYTLIQPIAQA